VVWVSITENMKNERKASIEKRVVEGILENGTSGPMRNNREPNNTANEGKKRAVDGVSSKEQETRREKPSRMQQTQP